MIFAMKLFPIVNIEKITMKKIGLTLSMVMTGNLPVITMKELNLFKKQMHRIYLHIHGPCNQDVLLL